MKKSSRSARRTQASADADAEANADVDSSNAAIDTDEATANIASAASPESGTGGDSSTASPVWRSTRLRSGHTSKIDYLKLHNTTSTGRAAAAATPVSGFAHRKRLGPSASTTPSRVDKRPKLSPPAAANSPTVPYACPICSANLSSSRSLDQHIVAHHANTQALECVFCGLSLRTAKSLQSHCARQHRVHASMPDSLSWRLTMQCRACGQSFRTAEHLARHMDWAHTRCSSIVLMEKLPDNWRWQRDRRSIMESADAVEEEYDLAFPGRRQFYSGHPDLLETDMSIQLQPATSGGGAGDVAAASSVDVYAFEDDAPDVDIDAGIIAKQQTSGGARRGRKLQKRRVVMEIDFDQLLAQRDEALDNEIDEPAEVQQPQRRRQLAARQQQSRQPRQRQPFASETPHYVSSRAPVSSTLQSFPCPICMADIATLKSRDRHLLQRHPGVRAFACLECDFTFETYISLRRHVRAEHPLAESGAYKLLIAPGLRRRARQRVVSSSATLAAAALAAGAAASSDSPIRPFQCTVCGVSFNRVNQLSAHYAAAHEGVGHQTAASQQQHRFKQRATAVLQDSAASMDMDDLDASAGSLSGNAALDELKLTCELCSAQFEKITALERHIADDHVDETPYECYQCPAYFPTFGRLRHHQRTVHRFFLQWKEPPQTVLSRMQSRYPPSAGGAQAGASTVLNLAVPLRRTDMAKVAHQQLRFFDSQSAANINLDTVLAGISPVDTVIFCDFCGETCHNKLELGRHLQSHSAKRLRFGCARCGQVFEGWNAKTDLVDHMKVDHLGKPRYRCSQCEAQFKFSSLLKLHRERGCNSSKPLARPVVSYGCANCERIICGDQSAERYQQHVQVCRGTLHRNLPSSAAVQPPPTAVISGLDGDGGGGDGGSIVDLEDGTGGGAATAGSRTVQVTLPGSKEPVSVLIHLEGPVSQETLNQAFVVQSALMLDASTVNKASSASATGVQQVIVPQGGGASDADDDVEPLQSLAQFAAAAADAADAEAAASSAAVAAASATVDDVSLGIGV